MRAHAHRHTCMLAPTHKHMHAPASAWPGRWPGHPWADRSCSSCSRWQWCPCGGAQAAHLRRSCRHPCSWWRSKRPGPPGQRQRQRQQRQQGRRSWQRGRSSWQGPVQTEGIGTSSERTNLLQPVLRTTAGFWGQASGLEQRRLGAGAWGLQDSPAHR